MPSNLVPLFPLRYPQTISIANPGEPRTIESIGGGAAADGVGIRGITNRTDYLRSRMLGPLLAPMQAVVASVDTNQDAGMGTTSMTLHYARLGGSSPERVWLAAAVGVGSFWSYDGVNWDATGDVAAIGGSESAWHEMASNGTRAVIVGDNEVRNTAWPISWASCTGGVTSGAWRAIVHDGTNFIAGSSVGTFARSSDGEAFSSAINGGAGWLAGPNIPAQIAVGKGPDGTSPRVIAVPNSGDLEVFAASSNNGATWSDVTAPSSTLEWHGVAYRETDHTWVAYGSAMGNVAVYASTDGGDNWVHQKTFAGGNGHRLWLMNDTFVTMIGSQIGALVYAYDTDNWRAGLATSRANGATPFAIRSFVKGAGRFAWLHAISDVSIYISLSQAGDFEEATAL